MNPSTPGDPRDASDHTAIGQRLDFATILDHAEGRLAEPVRAQVAEQLREADPATRARAGWVASFLAAAQRHRRHQVPSRVRSSLQQHYAQWWGERSRPEADDWDEAAARLVFDSRRAVNLVGVRGVHTDESVQLAYAMADLDVVVDLISSADGGIRVEGQVLASESEPQVTPLSVVLQGTDEEPRRTDLDHLNRFAFDPAYGPALELIVRAGNSRWRLTLDSHRIR